MQAFTSPEAVEVEPEDNAVSALQKQAAADPDAGALAYRDGDRFVGVSRREVVGTVEDLAAGMVGFGIRAGDRVAVFSTTRIEYTYLQYAAWSIGAATVTIYDTSSVEQVRWIMSDSGAVAIFCETDALRSAYEEVAATTPDCKHVFVIDEGGLDQLRAAATDETRAEVARRTAAITHDDLALVIYTSGTTGRPKGCMLTHYNFIWTVRQAVAALPELFLPGQSNLMFLPLAHSFAQIVQVGCLTGGAEIGYSTGIKKLVEELAIYRPTWVFAAPRVFEKVYNSAMQKAQAEGKGKIFGYAARVAIDYSRGIDAGSIGLKTKALHAVFDKLVYSKIRAVFGGRLEYAISGSAALGERLGHFFRGIGVTILEGYGLTETNSATCVNRPNDVRIGTVGPPLPGWSVAIADDGEILIKGGGVFTGYYNNEAATAEVFDEDGWFHTGDIGQMSEDGFLRITGRKKDLIVTAGGKNVAPAVLEDRLRAHFLISQCIVVGDARPFIAALVTIDEEALPAWAAEHDKPGDLQVLIDDPDMLAEIESAIDEANKIVSRAESIRAFRILPEDFTIEGGEITPTLKVKRPVVEKKYDAVIADIYGT